MRILVYEYTFKGNYFDPKLPLCCIPSDEGLLFKDSI